MTLIVPNTDMMNLVMGDVSIAYFIKSNNLYATSFLKDTEYDLRRQCDDVDEEIRKIEEAAKAKEDSKHVVDGWTLRDHQETGIVDEEEEIEVQQDY